MGTFLDIPLGSRDVLVQNRPDGTIVMRAREELKSYPRVLTERLFETAARYPDRVFIAEKASRTGWTALTYCETARAVLALSQALLNRSLGPEHPLAILSAGSVKHALLALAATHAGIPYCPVSPAYSLIAQDFEKLDHVLGLLTPGLIYVEEGEAWRRALEGAAIGSCEVVAGRAPLQGHTTFDALLATMPTERVDEAFARIQPDDVNKILFTSGSTGFPKGVSNTHRMVCANQQMFVQSLPAVASRPPVLLSWLPWHHTSGANMILGLTVYCGGTLYIDDGKPLPGLMDRTLANLREISPTAYFTAPAGFHELVPALREDEALRRAFFRNVQMFYYSGSSMPEPLIAAMDQLALQTIGAKVPFFSNYGATETAPFALAVNWPDPRGGLVGLPVPGADLKLRPVDGKLEACMRGPHVMPGYWRQPELSTRVFDSEGYYCYGDAVAPVDPADFTNGLRYEGRLGENFKLLTGTWVSVGLLRDRLIAAASPLVRDVAIAGENRSDIGALIFPDLLQVRKMAGLSDQCSAEKIASHPLLHARLQSVLDELARKNTGSSTYIARAMVMVDPPSADAGELTDKGSINQKIVLARRAADVAALYAVADGVIVAAKSKDALDEPVHE